MGNVTKEYLIKQLKNHESQILDKKYPKEVSIMPTASSTYEGQSYLLTAPQTGYIEGGIYKCEEVTPSTSPKTYYWKLINGTGDDIDFSDWESGTPSGETWSDIYAKKADVAATYATKDEVVDMATNVATGRKFIEYKGLVDETAKVGGANKVTLEKLSDNVIRIIATGDGWQGTLIRIPILLGEDIIFVANAENIVTEETGNFIFAMYLIKQGSTPVSLDSIFKYAGHTSDKKIFELSKSFLEEHSEYVVDGYITISIAVAKAVTADLSIKAYTASGKCALTDKKVLFLGDSITTNTYWWTLLFNIMTGAKQIANVAYPGAILNNYSDTVADGENPSSLTDHKNTLQNQVEKVRNNAYEAPDLIVIAIGTNGGLYLHDEDINGAYTTDFEELDLTNGAHAFRYANETLRELYPNAVICWCNPIQRATVPPATITAWANNLEKLTSLGATNNIQTNRCGINWAEENKAHVYLGDGLHPNFNGSIKIAKYNAAAISKLFL